MILFIVSKLGHWFLANILGFALFFNAPARAA
jgi:hypothetical protein